MERLTKNPDLTGIKILIVEDNDDCRQMLETLVGVYGATTFSASDGEEGLKTAQEVRPELVFCDIWMPKMDGYDFINAVRKDDDLCSVRVVAVSAFSGHEVDRTWRAGFSGQLKKPFDVREFEKLLTHVFWDRIARS